MERGARVNEAAPVRCAWADGDDPVYVRYHDEEWGRPRTDDRALYEKLCLEGFQAGLSWLTVLRKRSRFREVFGGFDPAAVAAFGPADVDRLLADPGIIRSRPKIEAAIANARATLTVIDEEGSLAGFVWRYAPAPGPAPASVEDLPARTAESMALARDLKRRGFRFVGPTTAYAFLQAMGFVNDHVAACHVRAAVAAEQDAVRAGFASATAGTGDRRVARPNG